VDVLKVHVAVKEPDVILRLGGEIDLLTAAQLEGELRRAGLLASGRVTLDLQEVTFVDASGLGALITARNELGDRLNIRGARPRVRRLIILAGLDAWLGLDPEPGTGSSEAQPGAA